MFHFYFPAPSWVDLLTLLITFIGLLLAFKAYYRWKDEKEWEIKHESKAMVWPLFYGIYSQFVNTASGNIEFITKADTHQLANQYLSYLSKEGIGLNENETKIAVAYERLKSVRKPDEETKTLIEFYKLSFELVTDMKNHKLSLINKVLQLSRRELEPMNAESPEYQNKLALEFMSIKRDLPKPAHTKLAKLKDVFNSIDNEYIFED